MIDYDGAKFHPRLLVKLKGSVFPYGAMWALPPGLVSFVIRYWATELTDAPPAFLGLHDQNTVLGVAWTSAASLLGFVLVFRTSQAYSRFWEGAGCLYTVMGFWYTAASSLVAFQHGCKLPAEGVLAFRHKLVRLISMLTAVVLVKLSQSTPDEEPDVKPFELELIDAEGIDEASLQAVNDVDQKAELIMHWILQLVVEYDQQGAFSVAPPILSRCFQELASGMVTFHEAEKLAQVPLPFPYMQSLELLLLLHWMACPVLTAMWVTVPGWAGLLSFMQVFIFWCLNCISSELENPFGHDVNDLPVQRLQIQMNNKLLLLLRPLTYVTPTLSSKAALEESEIDNQGQSKFGSAVSATDEGVIDSQGRRFSTLAPSEKRIRVQPAKNVIDQYKDLDKQYMTCHSVSEDMGLSGSDNDEPIRGQLSHLSSKISADQGTSYLSAGQRTSITELVEVCERITTSLRTIPEPITDTRRSQARRQPAVSAIFSDAPDPPAPRSPHHGARRRASCVHIASKDDDDGPDPPPVCCPPAPGEMESPRRNCETALKVADEAITMKVVSKSI